MTLTLNEVERPEVHEEHQGKTQKAQGSTQQERHTYKARRPSRCCTWKGPERAAFTKTTRSALVRMLVTAPLRIPVGTILCRARLLDGAIITEVGPLGTTRISSVQSLSRVQLFATPWTSGLPVHRQVPEFTQTHVH